MFWKKKRCVIFGNCQANALARLLRHHGPFTRKFQIVLKTVHEMSILDAGQLADEMQSVSLFIAQDVSANYLPPGTRALVEMMRPNAEALLFPVAWFNAYNPDMIYLHDEQGKKLRSPLTEYHSRIIVEAFNRDAPEREALSLLEAPTDPASAMLNVDACLAELRRREANLDLTVADEIAQSFQEKRLFYTINHPTAVLQCSLANTILKRLGLASLRERNKKKRMHQLNEVQWPINIGTYQGLELNFERPAVFAFDGKVISAENFVKDAYAFYRTLPMKLTLPRIG